MRSLLTLCCESAVVDLINNRLSIFNVLDEVNVLQFPTVLAKVTLVFVIEREAEEEQQFETILTVSHSGNELVRSPMAANFGDKQRLRLIPVIQGFVLPGPGVFRAAMRHNDQEMGFWEFKVGQSAPSQAVQETPSASPSPSA
jgi:hypothetical protein